MHTSMPRDARAFPGEVSSVLVLDHDAPIPLHEQLADLLRQQITSNELTGRVPSILTLAQEHGISHRTAAHALTTLRDEGLIISVRGKGYYVANR